MDITRETLSPLHDKITLKISPSDYQEEIEKNIKDLTKKVAVNGFRKGHVPAGIIKKMHGQELLIDELNKVVDKSITTFLKDNTLDIFGQPLPTEDTHVHPDINNPSDYEFKFEIGIVPPVTVKPLSISDTFEQKTAIIDDKVLDEEVEALQLKHGKLSHPDTITEDDYLRVSFDELDEKGALKPNGIHSESSIGIKAFKDDKVTEQVLKLKKDDHLDFDIRKTFGNDEELIIHSILRVDHHAAEHMGNNFRMTILEINKIDKAELDQDLFDIIFGPGTIHSSEEFRNRIKSDLELEFNQLSEDKLRRELRNKLIEQNDFTVPEDFLKKWLTYRYKTEENAEDPLKNFDQFITNLKWDIITDKIAKENSIKITDEEVKAFVKDTLKTHYFKNQEDANIPVDSLNQLAEMVLGKDDNKHQYQMRLLNDKIFSLLKSSVTIQPKAVSLEEFYHH
jgi:trigger factor